MSDQTTAQWLRAAVDRIAMGSSRICLVCARQLAQKLWAKGRAWKQGISGWLGEASGLNWAFRVALLVGGALIIRKLAGGILVGLGGLTQVPAARWLLWPAATVWIITSYRIGHPNWTPKTTTPADDSTEPEQGEGQQNAEAEQTTATPDAPLPSPLDVCGAVWRVGTPHAHLAVLAEELDTTTDRVREVLATKGIPIEPVRMRGRGSSTGVKASHFPTPAAPSDGVVAAGQPTNNDNNNVRVERHANGAHITVTPGRQDVNAA
ncbi:hypothetical protein ACFRH6_14440 [Streptomyces sp. NPDC056749]|uniref:hypothetical protein n=1 Tax=Streptomyces sp. NPDC056749 TaxID=3345936 RepID=UPI0036C87C11